MDQSFKKKMDEDHKIDKFEKVFDEKQASVRADLRETLAYRELNTDICHWKSVRLMRRIGKIRKKLTKPERKRSRLTG